MLDASRVPAWDTTALVQVRALARDLAQQGVQVQVCGLDEAAALQLGVSVERSADLDRALERVEDQLLAERPAAEAPPATVEADWLGELGDHVQGPARQALEAAFVPAACAPRECIFQGGDPGRDLLVVRSGHVTMATRWPPGEGVRLATIGRGMVFGEMAFLNGLPRTACAGCEAEPAELMCLDRQAFDRWAAGYPREALVVLTNLALMGTRRLAATTRQLRAALE